MANTLQNLDDELFAQIERLNDPNLSPEEIDREIKRAKPIIAAAKVANRAAGKRLKAVKAFVRLGRRMARG